MAAPASASRPATPVQGEAATLVANAANTVIAQAATAQTQNLTARAQTAAKSALTKAAQETKGMNGVQKVFIAIAFVVAPLWTIFIGAISYGLGHFCSKGLNAAANRIPTPQTAPVRQ